MKNNNLPQTTKIKNPNTKPANRMMTEKEIKDSVINQTYSDLLKSPLWQRKRLEIMQRDNFSCAVCGDAESMLHVHHKEYINGRKPWEYNDSELITLCENCHNEIHNPSVEKQIIEVIPERYKNLIESLENNNFNDSSICDIGYFIDNYFYECNENETMCLCAAMNQVSGKEGVSEYIQNYIQEQVNIDSLKWNIFRLEQIVNRIKPECINEDKNESNLPF